LNEAGAAIQSALEAETDAPAQLTLVRAQLLARVTRGQGVRRSAFSRIAFTWNRTAFTWNRIGLTWTRTGLGWVGAAAALASVGALYWTLQGPRPLSFEIGDTGVRGQTADLVEASATDSVALRFSEGSVMDLQPLARARVLSAAADGARVLLERGAAEVSVVHQAGQPTHWAFEAGPFVVAVTGTRFHLAWQPDTQRMALTMTEGAVLVTAPCLAGPREVVKGERLELTCGTTDRAGAFVVSTESTLSPGHGAEGATPVVPAPEQAAGERIALAPESWVPGGSGVPGSSGAPGGASAPSGEGAEGRAQSAAPPESWKQLLDARDWAGAVRGAERQDFATVCRAASLGELQRLANAARLSGNTGRATEALTILRQRFAGSDEAATAAFTLGRMAFDQRHDYKAATQWFGSYLRERPSGPLMGDAIGRLMEARQRGGDRAGARADAKRYLERFPNGPYAPAAAAILAE
jgi:transmembrane sensor